MCGLGWEPGKAAPRKGWERRNLRLQGFAEGIHVILNLAGVGSDLVNKTLGLLLDAAAAVGRGAAEAVA